MSIVSREPQFKVESPPEIKNPEVARAERDLNEIIPVLAHGLVRRIEQKGFSGKVRVRAMAGDQWGVAKSPDNPTDVPNVIIYPRESLFSDKRLTNARLRHEIGNLNYPIDAELNGLRDWCKTHDIAPELLTSLVEATHEASVNYLEMRNSHSDRPEENFRALYEHDINTQQIADSIGQSAPYKQAVDIILLYSLSQTGLIPKEQFEQALRSADPSVQEVFDKQTRSVLDQAVKMAVPKKQVQLVRDYLWPKFSKLISPPPTPRGETAGTQEAEAKSKATSKETVKTEIGKVMSATQAQMHEIQKRLQKMMEKLREHSQQQKQTPRSQQQKPRQEGKQERKAPQQKELSAAEKLERAEEKNLLAKNLQEQLQTAKDQLEQLQKPGAKLEAQKPQEKPSSMEEIGKQAEQMKQEAEKAIREAKETGADEITEEQLQKLKEQLEQLEEVAKQIAESGALEKELAKPEKESLTYNIKEYGINEAELAPEQLEMLQKTRSFARNTSKVYRTAMRLLMTGYQQKNPKFTDKMMQKMMERGYDLPDFSIYGSQAAQEFLSQQPELGIEGFGDNFLVNFQLPKPMARFWYKGGGGTKSIPVKEGEIEWGHFYRMCMPIIYSGVDRAQMSGLYLNRLNQFGQHDPKKYYYLWETIIAELPKAQGEEDKEVGTEEGKREEAGAEGMEGLKLGGKSTEFDEEGVPQGEQGTGAAEQAEGGIPSAGEIQDLISQMQKMLNQAKGQGGASGGQEAIQQMLDELASMQESLQSGASPQELAKQMSEAVQKMSEMMGEMQGLEMGEGQRSFGNHEISVEKLSGGQIDESGFKKAKIESEAVPFEPMRKGGAGNLVEGEGVTFSRPDPNLIAQLRNMEMILGSKFTKQDEHGNFTSKDFSNEVEKISQEQLAEIERKSAEQLSRLEELKRQHQAKTEALYKEMSGLEGNALHLYIEYMESMKDLTDDLTDFFIEKFDLDREYIYERRQRRGARLQRDYTRNIVGTKEGKPVIGPRSFERKRSPEMPQFVWTIVLDNTGSVGNMIENEKMLAVSLIEVTKRLDIPFEIVIYTEGGYQFLKTFEQEAYGEDLQKVVLLQATIGNQQDTDLLRAAYTSQTKFSDKFKRSHNFIFFLTDGLACSADSLHDLVNKFKKETVILGVGLAQGAETIKKEFGKNALEVPDSKQLSSKFIRKLEELIDQTFD